MDESEAMGTTFSKGAGKKIAGGKKKGFMKTKDAAAGSMKTIAMKKTRGK